MFEIHVTNGRNTFFVMNVLAIPRANELVSHDGKRYIVLQVIHHNSAVEVLVVEIAIHSYYDTMAKETNANPES